MFIFIKEAMTTPPGSVIHALFVFTAAVFAQAATAADYPTKPVRLLVGFPPGGAVDVTARTLAPPASERLKQQVVVDNRGGAHGNIAAEIVLHLCQTEENRSVIVQLDGIKTLLGMVQN